MPAFFAERALLPGGWAENVRLEVSADGLLSSVQANGDSQGAERVSGPLLPGMPNLHSHAFQRAMAGLAEVAGNPSDSFWTWRDLMYRLVGQISAPQVGVIARQLYIEMLKGGFTSVAEFHYVHQDTNGKPYADPAELALQISQAATSAGIGLTLLPVLYSHSGFGGQAPNEGQRRFIHSTDSYLDLQARLRPVITGQAAQNLGLCFHSLRAVTPQQISEVLAASDRQCPVHIHIAEQQKEVDDCLNWSGRRPLQWLYENVAVDQRWCLVHATHAEPDEVALMAQSGSVAGLCLTTEANLGDGIFPAVDYIAQGGRWGIGSDSHVSVSVVEELRWLEYGQRLRDQRRNRLYRSDQPMVGRTLFDAALSGGAQALGQGIGKLEVGQRADWVVLDGSDPYLETASGDAILNRWLFAGGDRQVRDVLVNGRWVVREGRHAAEEESSRAFAQVLRELLG
ncbi:formimidoylglutamate deiminase [Pseudomonas lijiangensis]|uniref:Formimidoylglutamate deiminase n=1 Tax=Pseudomonas lijiangensis TaxID=2995658 RepID=A0ABX8HR61_9PSED|nr:MULTISPECIES: formimidoylglutamate deiminase [Pseudomonas syringae group]MBX8493065.1 formimidoylglutamate deiminase [Pseudomonas cichorii]MBX8501388.1 formimidoylglutamate deiminase [Pseudomonas lijiangensis]MBX8506223.1 formimidoylglutamate deiminase [Pseudomonas lijiangensis]MBX8522926.1 formimidoylglutamate deiminase [Pseudomonas cichorii]MBX8552433.1 formimidoylglutamate deiminase [Pseudomonas cichorii]